MTTITRVYDTYNHAREVYDKLRREGFDDAQVSLVADKQTSDKYDDVADGTSTGAGVGATVGGGAGLLAGLGIIAIPGIGPVVAAGWLAATLLGAVAGAAAGGLVGALTKAGIPEAEAGVYAESIRRGGTMIVVKTTDATQMSRAQSIMDASAPVDLIMRAEQYRREGWKGYDPSGGPYVSSDLRHRPPAV